MFTEEGKVFIFHDTLCDGAARELLYKAEQYEAGGFISWSFARSAAVSAAGMLARHVP